MKKTCIVLMTLFTIVIGIMILAMNRDVEPLLVTDIPNTKCQLEVKSTQWPCGVEINIKSGSEIEELIKYPISQDLRNIVKGDIEFRWEGDLGVLRVNGETKIAEFKICLNKKTYSYDYEVKTYTYE